MRAYVCTHTHIHTCKSPVAAVGLGSGMCLAFSNKYHRNGQSSVHSSPFSPSPLFLSSYFHHLLLLPLPCSAPSPLLSPSSFFFSLSPPHLPPSLLSSLLCFLFFNNSSSTPLAMHLGPHSTFTLLFRYLYSAKHCRAPWSCLHFPVVTSSLVDMKCPNSEPSLWDSPNPLHSWL